MGSCVYISGEVSIQNHTTIQGSHNSNAICSRLTTMFSPDSDSKATLPSSDIPPRWYLDAAAIMFVTADAGVSITLVTRSITRLLSRW